MRKLRAFLSFLVSFALIFSMLCTPVFAAGVRTERVDLSDGSYYVVTIHESTQNAVLRGAVKWISGTKNIDRYSANDTRLWTFCVKGTFQYDGTSATAVDADYGYTIYDSTWSFSSGSASCVGAKAVANGSFRLNGLSTPQVTVTLTCSADGTLS